MLKRSLIYLVLSILVVIFAKFAHMLIVYISMLYAFINVKLAPVFSYTGLSLTLRKITLLVLLPVLITTLPALAYRLIKRSDMPYFIESTWCVWLVIALSNLLIY